jgi:hypothetical protein
MTPFLNDVFDAASRACRAELGAEKKEIDSLTIL